MARSWMRGTIMWTILTLLMFLARNSQSGTADLYISNEILNDIRDENSLIINGRVGSLNNMYDGHIPDVADFKVGPIMLEAFLARELIQIKSHRTELNLMCINDYCLKREFHNLSSVSKSASMNFVGLTDIANSIYNQYWLYPPLTVITGDARFGKSVALAQLERAILNLKPYSWIVRVDIAKEFPTEESLVNLTYANIIEKKIGSDYADFFHSILQKNPRAVIFIFDGVDITSRDRSDKICLVFDNIIRSKAKIIIASDPTNVELLQKHFNMEVFKLQALSRQETQKFFDSIWRTELDKTINEGTLTHDKLNKLKQRLAHYADKFTRLLLKTDLPRPPLLLKILAEVFVRQNSSLILWLPKNYTVGCLDYILGQMSMSRNLTAILEQVYINKSAIFERLVNDVTEHYEDLTPFYELVAVDNIVRRVETGEKADEYLISYKDIIANIPSFLRHNYAPFMKLNGIKIEFINFQYEDYFASIFLTDQRNKLDADSIRPLHHTVLIKEQYESILEFMNLQDFNITESIFDDTTGRTQLHIIHKLTNNGFENLFLQQHRLSLAFTNNKEHLRIVYLYSKEDYNQRFHIWRMIQSSSRLDFNLTTDNRLVPQLTPIQKMVEYNMLELLKVLWSSGFWYKKTDLHCEYYVNVLQHAVTRTIPNLDIVDFLVKEAPIEISDDQWSRLLYDTVYHAGEESRLVADYLIKKGAQPDFVINNRTLIHAAVRWNSESLVRYVMDDLHASILDIENSPRHSVFEAALDANPSPFYTVDGWWDMMLYLTPRINLVPYPINQTLLNSTMNLPDEETSSPWFKLMIFAEVSPRHLDNNARNTVCQPIEQNLTLADNPMKVVDEYGLSAWPLNPETLTLRRLAIMADQLNRSHVNQVSPLETFAMYRGINTLSQKQFPKYQAVMKRLMNHERQSMTPTDAKRIFQTLLPTIRSQDDYSLYCSLLKLAVERLLTWNQVIDNLELLQTTLNVHSESSAALEIPVFDRLNLKLFESTPMLDSEKIITKNKRLLKRIRKTLQLKNPNDDNVNKNDDNGNNMNLQISRCLTLPISSQISQCRIFWNEINAIGSYNVRNNIFEIRINSDRFISRLSNFETSALTGQADQLIGFLVNLNQPAQATISITGNSQMITRDILQSRALTSYRQNSRLDAVLAGRMGVSGAMNSPQNLGLKLYSKTAVFRVAISIPLIRAFDQALTMCLLERFQGDCLEESIVVGSQAAVFFGSFHVIEHIPRIITHLVAASMPYLAAAPGFMMENLLIFEHYGIKYGAQIGSIAFAAADIAIEVYNIGSKARMLIQCRRNPGLDECNIRNRALSWISLSFSAVSIIGFGFLLIAGVGAVPILLFTLARVLIEAITTGITNAAYYSHQYHTTIRENTVIFFRSLVFLPPPPRVIMLQRRKDWIDILNKHAIQYLKEVSGVLGYATGLGVLTPTGVEPSWGYINMNISSSEHTKRLSRVIPGADPSTVQVCLPAQNKSESYDADDSRVNTVASAQYECQNTFVIIKKINDVPVNFKEDVILYDLKYINEGKIVGSPIYNNLYLIFNGSTALSIVTSSGNVSNTFMFESQFFQGDIHLSRNYGKPNILDVSAIKDLRQISFYWFSKFNVGKIWANNNYSVALFIADPDNNDNSLFIRGRSNLRDYFRCFGKVSSHIEIDGGGGKSISEMDVVKTCKYSIIRPFTIIFGDSRPNSSYTTYLPFPALNTSLTELPESDELNSEIFVKNSKFMVVFTGVSLLTRIKSVSYSPEEQSLEWALTYTSSKVLYLSITPYNIISGPNQDNATIEPHHNQIRTLFLDQDSGMLIFPITQNASSTNSESITIREFFGMVSVNYSSIHSIDSHYKKIMNNNNMHDLSLTVKFHTLNHNENFIFGGFMNDRFLLDDNITLLVGNNGSDMYILTDEARKCIYIDNHALDYVYDKFLIHEQVCDSLTTVSSGTNHFCTESSASDIILKCTFQKDGEPKHINIVLRKYSNSSVHRHLEIYWRNATYTLLPDTWMTDAEMAVNVNGEDRTSRLAIFGSLETKWRHTVMLTSHDLRLVLYSADPNNSFVAYKSGHDIYICTKYWDHSGLPLVILEGFFANSSHESIEISHAWENLKIYFMRDVTNDIHPRDILTVQDVLILYFETILDVDVDGADNTDLLTEYHVNVANSSIQQEIIIDHNNDTSENGIQHLGVLVITGAQPKDVTVRWQRNIDTTLEFCLGGTVIAVKNWSDSPRKRLHRIEFINSIDQPVVVDNLDELKIDQQDIDDFNAFQMHSKHEDQFLHQIQQKFINAQGQYNLIKLIGHSDDTYLKRCVSILYTGYASKEPVYQLLGFRTYLDQMKFVLTCIPLLTKANLGDLSHVRTAYIMESIFQLSSLRDSSKLHRGQNLPESFRKLSDKCWRMFLSSLYDDQLLIHGDKSEILTLLSECISRN